MHTRTHTRSVTRMHTCMHIGCHAHERARTHNAHAHTLSHAHKCTRTRAQSCTRTHACTYAVTLTNAPAVTCTHTCMHAYMHTHTHSPTTSGLLHAHWSAAHRPAARPPAFCARSRGSQSCRGLPLSGLSCAQPCRPRALGAPLRTRSHPHLLCGSASARCPLSSPKTCCFTPGTAAAKPTPE